MKIGGLQEFTLIDYPEHIACIVFTIGCNFRCPYCYNRELVLDLLKPMNEKKIFDFLHKRKGKLEGVVITGGEPTIHSDLKEFIKKAKDLGYLIKLDSNGSNPKVVENLIEENLIDYLAMDVKTSLSNYSKAAGVGIDKEKIRKSIQLIKEIKEHEFRMTVVPRLVDKEAIKKIGGLVEGGKKFYLQQFEPKNTLNSEYTKKEPFPKEKLKKFKKILSGYVNQCKIRKV